jgi:hypothetical protein
MRTLLRTWSSRRNATLESLSPREFRQCAVMHRIVIMKPGNNNCNKSSQICPTARVDGMLCASRLFNPPTVA